MSESKPGIEPSVLKEIDELHDQLDDQLAPYVGEFTRKEREENEKALASLGGEFNICFDALLETTGTGGMPTKFEYLKDGRKMIVFLDERKFFEAAKKTDPIYREHLQAVLKSDMEEFEEENKKASSAERNEYFSILAVNFITKLEFFSRLNTPEQITFGGKTAKQLETELNQANLDISPYAQQMMHNKKEFIPSKEPQQIDLVRLKVRDLFNNDSKIHAIDEIYQKAQEFGLELCPAEVGPAYRLAYRPEGELKKEQPMNEWVGVAMEQITVSDGDLNVFSVSHVENGVWLRHRWARPDAPWPPEYEAVFRLPVPASKT